MSFLGPDDAEFSVTPAVFLKAAKGGAPLPVLNGRDTTAQRPGISRYEAKRLVRRLKESGLIKVVGKRTVLTLQS